MARLVPAIPDWQHPLMLRFGYLYILINRPNGVLYVGVTSSLANRIYQHREGLVPGFTKRCGLRMLVHVEEYQLITDAIRRERAIKHWPRAWKVRLILQQNPTWRDLYEDLVWS
ncbi:MAG: GIY-YIG nuclease family protein [Bauldia sp.]